MESARFDGVEAEAGAALLGGQLSLRANWLSVVSSAEAGYHSKYALRPLAEAYTLAADRRLGDRVHLTARAHRLRRVGEEAHLRVDGRASIRLASVQLFADVRNAGDAAYLDITGNPAPGRSLHLGVERF